MEKLSNNQLIAMYSDILTELKNRQVIRSKNLLGDLGEYLAIDKFNNTPGRPNLQAAPTGTQNIDAISRNGERYSIKSTTGNLTGVFYGLEPKGSEIKDSQKFEYVLIVIFNDNFVLEKILQLNWESFINCKRWHKTMNAWNLSITKDLITISEVIYEKPN